jgi:type IV secretory pathway VirB6-like protein
MVKHKNKMIIRICHKITLLISVLFVLASCDNQSSPLTGQTANGNTIVTKYEYIIPAQGNVYDVNGAIALDSNKNFLTPGGWTSLSAQGVYAYQENDTVEITSVTGVVFTRSRMGSVLVESDGGLYYPVGLTDSDISPTKNCFGPQSYGAIIPSNYTLSQTSTSSTTASSSSTASSSTSTSTTTSTTTLPSASSMIMQTNSFANPSFTSASTPQEVFPGDIYFFYIPDPQGTSFSSTGPRSLTTISSSNYVKGTASNVVSIDQGSGKFNTTPCTFTVSSDCQKSGILDSPGSSCLTSSTSNCSLIYGQGLDVQLCTTFASGSGVSSCTSLRSSDQIMLPFISISDALGTNVDVQTKNQYIAELASAINKSQYLFSQDTILPIGSSDPMNSKAASFLATKSAALAVGRSFATNSSGSAYLAFKIDPTQVRSNSSQNVIGNYQVNYIAYSQNDMITDSQSLPSTNSGGLAFTFAASAPPAVLPTNYSGSTIYTYPTNNSAPTNLQAGQVLYMRVIDKDSTGADSCYSDNYGYYRVEVTVTSKPTAPDGWFTKISSYVINWLIVRLKFALDAFYGAIIIAPEFIAIVRSMLTLYIVMLGAYFALGMTQVTALDLTKRAVKIAIVTSVISPTSLSFFNEYLFTFFTNGFMEIVVYATVADATYSETQDAVSHAFGFVDWAISAFFAKDVWIHMAILAANPFTLLVVPLFCYTIFVYFRVVVEGFIGYLVMLTSIYFMLGMFPLFAILILFDYTRKYFWGWLNYTVNFALQPIIFFVMLSFMNSIIMIYLATFLNLDISWGCWFPIDINITSLLPAGVGNYLPTVKVRIFCFPFFLVDHYFTVLTNGFALLLIVQSLKSMMDFVPVLTEKLASSGFGASDGGIGVAPGATEAMTGGGGAGFGRDSSLAARATNSIFKGGRSLIASDTAIQQSQHKQQQDKMVGGREPVSNNAPAAKPSDAILNSAKSFMPPSMAGAGGPIAPPSAVAPSTPPASSSPSVASTGSPKPPADPKMAQYAPYQSPALKAMKQNVQDNHAKSSAASTAGGSLSGAGSSSPSSSGLGATETTGRSTGAPNLSSNSAPSGSLGRSAPPPKATSGKPPSMGQNADLLKAKGNFQIQNPLSAGKSLDQFKADKLGPQAKGKAATPPTLDKPKFQGQNPLQAGKSLEQFKASRAINSGVKDREVSAGDNPNQDSLLQGNKPSDLSRPASVALSREDKRAQMESSFRESFSQDSIGFESSQLREKYGDEVVDAFKQYSDLSEQRREAAISRELSYSSGGDKDKRGIAFKDKENLSQEDIAKLDGMEALSISRQLASTQKQIDDLRDTPEQSISQQEKERQLDSLVEKRGDLESKHNKYSYLPKLMQEEAKAKESFLQALEKKNDKPNE